MAGEYRRDTQYAAGDTRKRLEADLRKQAPCHGAREQVQARRGGGKRAPHGAFKRRDGTPPRAHERYDRRA